MSFNGTRLCRYSVSAILLGLTIFLTSCASIEEFRNPGTPINSLPYTIDSPGFYYVTENLDGSTGGIDITADNVTLNLMGFTLDGGGSINDYGIDLTVTLLLDISNVTIKNGTIRAFGRAGIYTSSASSRYIKVLDLQVLDNGTLGNSFAYSGIYLSGSNHHILRCTAGNNGGYGIYTAQSSILEQNIAHTNGGTYAIFGGEGSVLTGNTAYSNQGTGIAGSSGASLTGNAAYNNQGNYAIYGGPGAALTGNTVYRNTNWGIYGAGSNTINDNTVYENNVSNTAGQGGLKVGVDSRVVGNTLDSNFQNGIVVSSSDNILKDNHVTDSIPGNGILFQDSGNYYRENTAQGNGTAFNLGTTTQTDGGDNVAF